MTPKIKQCPILAVIWLAFAVTFTAVSTALGDSVNSRCGYSERACTAPETYHPGVFFQRQGYINISLGSDT